MPVDNNLLNVGTGRALNVSNTDFAEIKTELRQFLSNQAELNDYKYDGSVLDTLLDVFAYITHFNAFNANLALNESFLDSAQLRSSVVSHAKLLGYTPRSAYPARAIVDIEIVNPVNVRSEDGTFRAITLNKGTRFASSINNQSVPFTTTETVSVSPDTNGRYIFKNVALTQGRYIVDSYIFDQTGDEEFELSNPNAVTSTIEVLVQNSQQDTTVQVYSAIENFVDVDARTTGYYLSENRHGLYQVSFGDNVVGRRPANGNIIEIRYIATDRKYGNGANVFTLAGDIDGNTDVRITSMVAGSGGADKEDTKSIKFNAPLTFISQNRAVSANDYRSIIQQSYSNIDAITVWGGEDSDPPDYGRVYIAIAPRDKEFLSNQEKDFITANFLRPKNIVSIVPIIVDPSYTYIQLTVRYKYNPNITDLTTGGLSNLIRESIRRYDENELKRFDGVFRSSNISTEIDASDPSITSNILRVHMKKRFVPELGRELRYDITFSSRIDSGNTEVISSTEFIYLGQRCTLRDKLNQATGERVVQVITRAGEEVIIVNSNIGTIDVLNGKITLIAFSPDAFDGEFIEITARPHSDDLAPRRAELLRILIDDADIDGEIDTLISGGAAAGIDYQTTARDG